jgi:hypothetical protein
MATGPWRCSQCGTINEPVANSCRTCGRWPSLFDLQDNVVDEASEPVVTGERVDVGTFEPETFEPETFEPQPVEVDVDADDAEEAEGSASDRRRRVLSSLVVPLAFVAYIVISIIFGDRGSG